MTHYKLSRDINGNKICKITVSNERGFSIQTNGNLPETNRNGICNATPSEVSLHVKNFGTKRQKEILGF